MTMQNTLAAQLGFAKSVLHANVEGLGHEDSLTPLEPGGNNLNWVVGHLISAYDNLLSALGGEPVWSAEQGAPYKRGSDPVTAENAVAFDRLLSDFGTAHDRVLARLAAMSAEELAAPAPGSPTGNPNETLGSLAAVTVFHQAYHVGQTGLLRRLIGMPGAIR